VSGLIFLMECDGCNITNIVPFYRSEKSLPLRCVHTYKIGKLFPNLKFLAIFDNLIHNP